MANKLNLPSIPEQEQTPVVKALLRIIEELVVTVQSQDEQIQQLEDEISILKGETARPTFKPSKLDEKASEQSGGSDSAPDPKKRPGSRKRSKTAGLTIHEEKIIASDKVVPVGSLYQRISILCCPGYADSSA